LVYTRNGVLAILALARGMRALLEVHDLPQRRPFARALGALTHRRGLFIGSPSRSLLRYWRRYLGADPARLRHIPHGALPPVVRGERGDGADGDVAPAPGGLTILFVGSAAPGKGFATFLDVARRVPEHRFHGVRARAPERPEALPANLTLHLGVRPPDVPAFYGRADLLLLPVAKHTGKGTGARHRRQLVPLRAVEYLSAGAPIVASDSWPVREALAPTGAALFCPPDDPEAWAAAVRRLAADAGL